MNFVDRELETSLLNSLIQRQGAQLLILYGRRRIGKTRLLTHWLKVCPLAISIGGLHRPPP